MVLRKDLGLLHMLYQIVMRINKARQLLKQGESITAIAAELGFVDQSHFHRSFKRIVAATPFQYKSWVTDRE
ncbi:helix-turn-helix domain-containing protein [Jejubacter calystegiae]|uniref:Helix-turn-helix domain-containing protein n=1 Tax=Jejubacter calystegiae TaxID=2579935 RepID=A0A4P8YN31_9ENTR|nr:helix-turn-helix domain-containing protein [Jejubacter calystegiae]